MQHLYPFYPNAPILSIDELVAAIGFSQAELEYCAANRNRFYQVKEKIRKPDGTYRTIYSLHGRLRCVLDCIQKKFLGQCHFPCFLTGFIKDRSYIVNASRHCNKAVVIRLDVTNFFPSIAPNYVTNIWRNVFAFSLEAAELLTSLCTFQGGLPQGSPVSPALANLLFAKHEGKLFTEFSQMEYAYSRYADDILISSNSKMTQAQKSDVIQKVKGLVGNYNLKIKNSKLDIMNKGQRQIAHGLNINRMRLSVPKAKRSKIRAEVYSMEEEFKENGFSQELSEKVRSTVGKVASALQVDRSSTQLLRLKERIDALQAHIKSEG